MKMKKRNNVIIMIIISYHPIKKEKQNEIDSVSKKKMKKSFR